MNFGIRLKTLYCAAFLLGLTQTSVASAFEHHHDVAPAYQFTRISSERGTVFKVHSLALEYHGRYGGDLAGFWRASYLIPFRARQGDTAFSPLNQYDKHWGFDSILGITSRYHLLKSWEFDFGLGTHFQFMRMVSSQYVEWSTLTLGLGLQAHAKHQFEQKFLGAHPVVGLAGEMDFDFIDFARGGDLGLGFNARLAGTVGLAWGGSHD